MYLTEVLQVADEDIKVADEDVKIADEDVKIADEDVKSINDNLNWKQNASQNLPAIHEGLNDVKSSDLSTMGKRSYEKNQNNFCDCTITVKHESIDGIEAEDEVRYVFPVENRNYEECLIKTVNASSNNNDNLPLIEKSKKY